MTNSHTLSPHTTCDSAMTQRLGRANGGWGGCGAASAAGTAPTAAASVKPTPLLHNRCRPFLLRILQFALPPSPRIRAGRGGMYPHLMILRNSVPAKGDISTDQLLYY
eukprot:gene10001-biopygen1322